MQVTPNHADIAKLTNLVCSLIKWKFIKMIIKIIKFASIEFDILHGGADTFVEKVCISNLSASPSFCGFRRLNQLYSFVQLSFN